MDRTAAEFGCPGDGQARTDDTVYRTFLDAHQTGLFRGALSVGARIARDKGPGRPQGGLLQVLQFIQQSQCLAWRQRIRIDLFQPLAQGISRGRRLLGLGGDGRVE